MSSSSSFFLLTGCGGKRCVSVSVSACSRRQTSRLRERLELRRLRNASRCSARAAHNLYNSCSSRERHNASKKRKEEPEETSSSSAHALQSSSSSCSSSSSFLRLRQQQEHSGTSLLRGLGVAASLLALVTPLAAHAVGGGGAGGLYFPGLVGDNEFTEGFTSGLLLILFSEIGDKTFFVAMLLAVRQTARQPAKVKVNSATNGSSEVGSMPAEKELAMQEPSSAELEEARTRKLVVFAGTFVALSVMTVISCGIGRAFHFLDNSGLMDALPKGLSELPIDDVAAVILLTSFGITSLRDGLAMEGEKAREKTGDAAMDGMVLDIRGSLGEDDSEKGEAIALVKELEDEGKISEQQGNISLLLQVFLLVFAAEWGDRSFLSTIALSAAYPPASVVIGASAGHGIATALAIGGGSVLAQYVSEKTIAYTAGVLFLAFATATTVDLLAGNHLML